MTLYRKNWGFLHIKISFFYVYSRLSSRNCWKISPAARFDFKTILAIIKKKFIKKTQLRKERSYLRVQAANNLQLYNWTFDLRFNMNMKIYSTLKNHQIIFTDTMSSCIEKKIKWSFTFCFKIQVRSWRSLKANLQVKACWKNFPRLENSPDHLYSPITGTKN